MPTLLLIALLAASQDPLLHPDDAPHRTLIPGVELTAELVVDAFGVAAGGVERGFFPLGLGALGIDVDLDHLLGLPGWTADFHGLWAFDEGLAAAVGESQGPSNIEVADLDFWIAEAWAGGPLTEGLELQVGKLEVSADFGDTRGGGEFIAAAFGPTPIEGRFPTYPESAFGARLAWRVDEARTLQLAAFDGSLFEGRRTSVHGAGRYLEGRTAHFFIAEASQAFDSDRALASVGVWRSTADAQEPDGRTTSGKTGGYLTLDRTFAVDGPTVSAGARSVDAFLQLGAAQPDADGYELHAGCGAVLRGFLPARPDDSLGFGASWIGGAEAPGLADAGELLVEVHWRTEPAQHFVLQPALMVALDPAATPGADDALILGLRAIFSF